MEEIGIEKVTEDGGADTDNGPLCEQGMFHLLVLLRRQPTLLILTLFQEFLAEASAEQRTPDLTIIISTSTTPTPIPSHISIARE